MPIHGLPSTGHGGASQGEARRELPARRDVDGVLQSSPPMDRGERECGEGAWLPREAMKATKRRPSLASWRTLHGVAVHECTGAGHRYPWLAFFVRIKCRDGTVRPFTELAAEYSFAALEARHKVAHGDDAEDACRELARLNGIEGP